MLNHSAAVSAALQAPAPPQVRAALQLYFELDFGKQGQVYIELHDRQAPLACAQIERLAHEGFYDQQRVFKVITSPKPFIIQMGDPLTKTSMTDPKIGSGGSGVPVKYEQTSFHMTRGAVSLATLPGKPDSGDCQFFIVLGDYSKLLDGTATIFGQVVRGMTIVDHLTIGSKIESAKIVSKLPADK